MEGVSQHNTRPIVSVMMPTFNESRYVGAAVQSILGQTLGDLELIVVDDASTDGTPDIVASFADPRIRLIRNTSNRGPGACRNMAIEAARAPYLALMDADDISEPDRLEKQLAFLETHPDVDILGTDTRWIDGRGKLIGTSKLPTNHGAICARPLRGFWIAHASMMLRRSVMATVGGYDTELRRGEDYELLLRCMGRFRFGNLSEPLYTIRWLAKYKWAGLFSEIKVQTKLVAYIRRTRQPLTAYAWLLLPYIRIVLGPLTDHLVAMRVRWGTRLGWRLRR